MTKYFTLGILLIKYFKLPIAGFKFYCSPKVAGMGFELIFDI